MSHKQRTSLNVVYLHQQFYEYYGQLKMYKQTFSPFYSLIAKTTLPQITQFMTLQCRSINPPRVLFSKKFKRYQLILFTKMSFINLQPRTDLPNSQDDTLTSKKQLQTKADSIQTNPSQRLKSTTRQIIIGLIISLSALNFGYSLKQITSVPIAKTKEEYGITMDKFAAQSILIGVLPLGAIFGVIVTKFMINRFRRLTGIYVFTVVNIGAIILVNITTFSTLIGGRFIQGICVGYYTTIAPIYLKEIAPKELRRMLGLFFSFGKIVGVLIVILLQLSFEAADVKIGWRIILSMTAVFSILQAILIFFFGSDTPAEMIEKGNQQQAMNIIRSFYKPNFIHQIFQEYKNQFQMEKMKGKETKSQDGNIEKQKRSKNYIQQQQIGEAKAKRIIESTPNFPSLKNRNNLKTSVQSLHTQGQDVEKQPPLTFEQKKSSAYCLGVHLCIIRHWTGGNCIITQGGLFIKNIDADIGHYTSLIVNIVQFVFVVIGLIWVQKYLGKRPLFLISITLMSILNIALVVAMIYERVLPSLMIMCIFMVVYGGSFISPIWSYPSQIIPASQSLLPNIMHWLALATSTLIPPVITGIMPNGNPYPVFIFFGIYGFISMLHVFKYMRESDGKTYSEIIQSFK